VPTASRTARTVSTPVDASTLYMLDRRDAVTNHPVEDFRRTSSRRRANITYYQRRNGCQRPRFERMTTSTLRVSSATCFEPVQGHAPVDMVLFGHHEDAFDRLMIAQSIVEGLRIVSVSAFVCLFADRRGRALLRRVRRGFGGRRAGRAGRCQMASQTRSTRRVRESVRGS
jgi:hypothetical protein